MLTLRRKRETAINSTSTPSDVELAIIDAADKTLNAAKKIITDSEDRAAELRKLGFTGHPIAQREPGYSESDKAYARKYARKYPGYKFIPNHRALKIAVDNGLILGEACNFIADIPTVELEKMKAIHIANSDAPRVYQNDERLNFRSWEAAPTISKVKVDSFHVIAPLKDFNTIGYSIHGNMLVKEHPDPIVLKPIKGGYLIICAWGEEAKLVENH